MHEYTVVETSSGRVKGICEQGVHRFKGIPYGRDTSGKFRFMPPRPPDPWIGDREAFQLPHQCPQALERGAFGSSDTMSFFQGCVEAEPYAVSENCLALNLWTPEPQVNRRMPVMVWFHGGGFSQGSGGAPWYDGASLARFGEVVVITVNHRLGPLGYLHLAALGGEDCEASGNVGMLDLILALQWVQENVSRFGGDPGNVTIFGSSGGGCKVSTLMAMPKAKGLFHKAIVMSGVVMYHQPLVGLPEEKGHIAAMLMREVGLQQGDIEHLRTIPADDLLAALRRVQLTIGDHWGMHVSSPVVEGRLLPEWPFRETAPRVSAEIPLMIGTTVHEMGPLLDASVFDIREKDLAVAVARYLGVEPYVARLIVDAYRQDDFHAVPREIFYRITADHHFGIDMDHQAELKAAQGTAPVYKYLFSWKAPAFDGRYGAAHGTELPFIFNNLDKASGLGIAPEQGAWLRDRICGAWLAFARTGNPNHRLLPTWEPYEAGRRKTLVFDEVCRVEEGPGISARFALRKHCSNRNWSLW